MLTSWSFRKKLIFIWLTVQIIITVTTAFLLVKLTTDSMETDIVYQAEQIKPVLSSAVVTPLIQRDYASVIAILKELVTSDNIQEIIIEDRNGNLIAREPPEANQKNKPSISPLVVDFLIQADGVSLGKATLTISRNRLVETRHNFLLFSALIVIVTLLIFYLLALVLSRYVTRPISELAAIAENISKGNFIFPELAKRKDEIGLLQHAFKSMSNEIAKQINGLSLLNAELETRVRDRTKSLQVARDELVQKVEQLMLVGAVVDNSYFSISIADLRSPDTPLIYVNPAFTKITGFSAGEVLGTTSRVFQDGITDSEAMKQIHFTLENKLACTVEFLDRRRDGEDFWNRLSVFPVLIEENEPRYYVIFEEDISALKKVSAERETLLQEAQENQRLQSLGILVAGLAHEINNPLGIAITATTHVSQAAATVRKNASNLTGSALTDFLEDEEIAFQLIFDNLKRASDLVRGFKDVARDRSLDEKKEINLKVYLQSIEQSLTPVLKKSKCTLSLEVDPSISLHVNSGSLGQLLTNLVLNSTIHAFDGLKDRQLKISGSQTLQHIFLKVSDNGNGISENVLPNLFTPFYTTSRRKGGTGLGLYISRQIATEVLNGSLSVENLPEKGCEFTLKLPRY
jgi:PAS domain S-box-containing protein